MLLLMQICFCFVLRETSCCLLLTILKLMVLSLIIIDCPHFEQMVDQIYHTERQLNMSNSFDTEAPF